MSIQEKLEEALSEARFQTQAVNAALRDVHFADSSGKPLNTLLLEQQKNLLEQARLEVKAYQAMLLIGGVEDAAE
jgi:hypothetical protein